MFTISVYSGGEKVESLRSEKIQPYSKGALVLDLNLPSERVLCGCVLAISDELDPPFPKLLPNPMEITFLGARGGKVFKARAYITLQQNALITFIDEESHKQVVISAPYMIKNQQMDLDPRLFRSV